MRLRMHEQHTQQDVLLLPHATRGVKRRYTPPLCSSVSAEVHLSDSSAGVEYAMRSCTRSLKRATTIATAILISSCTIAMRGKLMLLLFCKCDSG